eukprot:1404290-Prymnesium_polylepis.1
MTDPHPPDKRQPASKLSGSKRLRKYGPPSVLPSLPTSEVSRPGPAPAVRPRRRTLRARSVVVSGHAASRGRSSRLLPSRHC